MNTSIHTFTRCRKREIEERIRLREWKCDIPRLQQYVQLHRPEQPSITYLTLALSFSMRLKFILTYTSSARIWTFVLALLLCLGIPFCHPSLQKRGSPKLLIGLEISSRWSDVLDIGSWLKLRVVGWLKFRRALEVVLGDTALTNLT